jgi:hypothetical protein
LRLVGFKLRGPFPDALLERLIEMTQFAFGFLGGGDVVSHADKADMLAGGIPARLRFRSHPPPCAVGPAISRFQHKRLERGLARDAFLHDPRPIVGMEDPAPVEDKGFLVGKAKEIQIGLIGEAARAIQLADPHRHWRAVGDQPETLFALPEQFLRQGAFGDVDMDADQPQRLALLVPFDLRLAGDPPHLSVAGPDDPVLRRITQFRTIDGRDKMLQGPLAVLGMKALDPVLVRIDRVRAQAVYFKIFGRAASAVEAVPEIDRNSSDPGYFLNAGKIVLAIL